jgi:chaperone required for assembly of F1-ATPase
VSDERDPVRTSQRLARPELPARFYEKATAERVDDAYALLLDGKVVKTPARKPMAVAERAVAEALAAEWEAQGKRIDPATMPMTRIVNAAIDRVGGAAPEVRAEIVKYAGSDLICYRAETPQSLIERQAEAWDPLVAWARAELGAPLMLAAGIIHVAQPEIALIAIARALERYAPLPLAAVSTVTALTGSAVIALALARGRLTPQEAWDAALVDEEWQMRLWGRDEAVMTARAFRWREMQAAALILSA